MVVIPKGAFTMGSPANEPDRNSDEGPQRRVSIARFALGRTEVTRGEFRQFVEATGHQGKRCYAYKGGTDFGWVDDADWAAPGFDQTDAHPAVCVSWQDAKAYLKWLNSQVEGAPYRLPSEAEWEYAARAGTTSAYQWGQDKNGGCAMANGLDQTAKQRFPDWAVSTCDDGHLFTAPASSYDANRFNLNDMIGNVWEWTEDCWHGDYTNAPTDGSAWMEGNGRDCSGAVVRGGSWYDDPDWLRSAIRVRLYRGFRDLNAGFRVSRTLPAR